MARPDRSVEKGPTRPGLANEKGRFLCTHSRVQSVTALMPTGRNADHRKWQYAAAMLTRAIRLTIIWQCDMVVNTAGRHSGRSAFRHGSNRQSVRFLYIDSIMLLRYSVHVWCI